MMEHVWIDRNDYTALLESLAKWKDKAANLEQENEKLKGEKDNLKTWADALGEGYFDRGIEVRAQNTRLRELKQENERLEKTRGDMASFSRKRIRGLKAENETLKANLTAAEGEIRRLQNEVEAKSERIESLEAELDEDYEVLRFLQTQHCADGCCG